MDIELANRILAGTVIITPANNRIELFELGRMSIQLPGSERAIGGNYTVREEGNNIIVSSNIEEFPECIISATLTVVGTGEQIEL